MLSLPLKVIDTVGGGKNKVRLFCYSTYNMGKLLPAAGGGLWSYDWAASSRRLAWLPPEGGFKLHSRERCTKGLCDTVCPCMLCLQRCNTDLQHFIASFSITEMYAPLNNFELLAKLWSPADHITSTYVCLYLLLCLNTTGIWGWNTLFFKVFGHCIYDVMLVPDKVMGCQIYNNWYSEGHELKQKSVSTLQWW